MKTIILFLAIVFVSCNASTKRTNLPQDINDGKALSDKFYELIKNESYHEASLLFGGEANPADVEELLLQLAEPQGAINEIQFVSGKSEVNEENKKVTGEIDLYYTVKYENMTKDENFVIKFVDNKMIIAGFHTDEAGAKK